MTIHFSVTLVEPLTFIHSCNPLSKQDTLQVVFEEVKPLLKPHIPVSRMSVALVAIVLVFSFVLMGNSHITA